MITLLDNGNYKLASKNMNGYKKLDEFTFADLYVEIPDQSLSRLKKALYELRKDELASFIQLLLTNKLSSTTIKDLA